MNIDEKSVTKILTNRIQEYVKELHTMTIWDLF